MAHDSEYLVVGAGIVGLATARALGDRFPAATITLLEQAPTPAMHQSGRNSGVIHSGLYYRPGSLKAALCAEGREEMFRFADEYKISSKRSGKLVVATQNDEMGRLNDLYERGRANGLAVELLDRMGVRAIEPHSAALAGIWVPETGVVDFAGVCRTLATELEGAGHSLQFGTRVTRIDHTGSGPLSRVRVQTDNGEYVARTVINCGGLWADRLVPVTQPRPKRFRRHDADRVSIVPFRGEYRTVVGPSADLVRTMMYPVPDPRFPFLGVHLTRGHNGTVHAGPNAVLALARDGYSWSRVNPHDVLEMGSDPSVWRLARRYWRTGVEEVHRSLSPRRYLESLRRLVPDIQGQDLVAAPSGVRAQAVDSSGGLLDDFVLRRSGNLVHVLNAPSPAATASLAIGRYIAAQL